MKYTKYMQKLHVDLDPWQFDPFHPLVTRGVIGLDASDKAATINFPELTELSQR